MSARTAILYIAERCNQSCVFCLEEDGAWNTFVDPATEEVYGIVERLQKSGATHITFMGGETFFRKDLPRIVAHAKSIGYTRIGVTTNGTVLAKPGFIADLTDAGLDFIELSIHGHTEELAFAISRAKVTYERQARAMEQINATGSLFTIVNVVVCDENAAHLLDIANYVLAALPDVPVRFKLKFVSLQGWAAEDVDAGRRRPLGYHDVDLERVCGVLAARGVDLWTYNVPLCRLGEHARHAHELATLSCDERYFDLDHRGPADYYDSGHQLEGRVWPASSCGPCTLRAVCPGLEETYRRVHGEAELRTRDDDPLPWIRAALAGRGLDPDDAPARLAVLHRQGRPATFVRERTDGALRFLHPDESVPLDLLVELREEGTPAYLRTARYALSYRLRDDGDRAPSGRVLTLLERAAAALREADARGADLDAARAAVAAGLPAGWTLAVEPSRSVEKKRSRVPVLSRFQQRVER